MSWPTQKDKKTYADVELPTDPNIPVWVITPKEEKLIFERWRKKTFERCDVFIRAFIECSNSYAPVDATKNCREANLRSMGCVSSYQTQKYLDIEREILISEKLAKRKLMKEKEKEKQQS